jgi:archaellum biogenesis ATPase FlaH
MVNQLLKSEESYLKFVEYDKKNPRSCLKLNWSSDDIEDITPAVKARDKNSVGMFSLKPANQWLKEAASMPEPKNLFMELWFEGELCIEFADTGQGKSVLAVQIGNEIAKTQKVVYFDLELSMKQFQKRYTNSEYENPFSFQDNFYRIEIDTDADIPDLSFEEYFMESIEGVIKSLDVKVLIIDNITYMSTETEKAKDALPLMKALKGLKSKYGLSMLILAHTPKRDLSKPITRNDLQGSKMLINFCDSSFAVGESTQGSDVKYIKQIKERMTAKQYGTDNVINCLLSKPDNFLHFEFTGHSSEMEHLKVVKASDREKLKEEAIKLSLEGLSIRQIAFQTSLSPTTVHTYLKNHKAETGAEDYMFGGVQDVQSV